MIKSIISTEKYCYECGTCRDLQVHHCWHGSNRQLADDDGLTVYLCQRCHRRLHNDKRVSRELDLKYMILAEKAWLEHYGKTIEDFIERYGKNYL